MSVPAGAVPTEKATSAWKNAKARLGVLGPELASWLDRLQAVGEWEGTLLLVDPAGESSCRRCEALISRAVAPLGYAEARISGPREVRPR